MTQELDDLLRPTVAASVRKGPLPWRVSSQFWVAFFGGIPAVTAIAFLNARRLGASARRQQWILLAGLVAVAAFIALFAWIRGMEDGARTMRIVGRVLAVVLFLVLARIQRERRAASGLRLRRVRVAVAAGRSRNGGQRRPSRGHRRAGDAVPRMSARSFFSARHLIALGRPKEALATLDESFDTEDPS
ncbi:MAG: hypothetical protein ACXWH7_03390, partial [Thermoanaerobaculia bacterium]